MATYVEPGTDHNRSAGNSQTELASHVMESPGKGAGIYYADAAHGIPIQLGSVGITVGLLSAGYVDFYPDGAFAIIAPVALSVGAVGVSIGGAWNIRAGNSIAGTIGTLYGVFFLSLALILFLSAASLGEAVGPAGLGDTLGTYFGIWAIISACLTYGTFFVNKSILVHQALVTAVFVCLAIAESQTPGGSFMFHLAGYIGLGVMVVSFFIVTAFVVNDTSGKATMPLP